LRSQRKRVNWSELLNILVATFSGLGNLIGTLPLLRGIASRTSTSTIFLPEPTGEFAASAVEMFGQGLNVRFYPAEWRRFLQSDWKKIQLFIERENVRIILNWRNEGPKYDFGFYAFRAGIGAQIGAQFYDGWDLGEEAIRRLTWWELATEVTRLWAPDVQKLDLPSLQRKGSRIDLFSMASTSSKRWSTARWCGLLQLLAEHSDVEIGIHLSPDTPEENHILRQCASSLGKRFFVFGPYKHMRETVEFLGDSMLAITLDSFPAHLCVLLGIPCITCFFCTDPDVWAHRHGQQVIGGYKHSCSEWKIVSGNCRRYYSDCQFTCKQKSEIAAGEVLSLILKFLDGRQ
jgi:ADP-heptose:LPS heptosyltransferase